jgi:hypothetical protein
MIVHMPEQKCLSHETPVGVYQNSAKTAIGLSASALVRQSAQTHFEYHNTFHGQYSM